MIKVFYGENRVLAQAKIRDFLGDSYEIVEGSELTLTDLPNIFRGVSLFDEKRAILIRDVLANRQVAEEIVKYLDSPYLVAIWELKIDKRAVSYKSLKDQVDFIECVMPRDQNAGMVFDIYKTAKRDGKKAVQMLVQIKDEQDPMRFFGLMVSQAMRDCQKHLGAKEKRVLKELSRLDMQLKYESKLQPWMLISAFLLRLSAL